MYGSVVRQAREGRGLTQVELAEISGIKQANISAIENDRRQPSAETFHRLLESCGFELVASAGARSIAVAPRSTGDAGDAPSQPSLVTGDTPIELRARLLVAALDASEAIVRGRLR